VRIPFFVVAAWILFAMMAVVAYQFNKQDCFVDHSRYGKRVTCEEWRERQLRGE
jgi:hypothetical protein